MSRKESSKRPVYAVIIMICIGIIISLAQNATGLYQSRSRLETAKQKIDGLGDKKNKLKQQVIDQADPAALDREIRNKLNMTKPGETTIVIPSPVSSNTVQSNNEKHQPMQVSLAPITQWYRLLVQRQRIKLGW